MTAAERIYATPGPTIPLSLAREYDSEAYAEWRKRSDAAMRYARFTHWPPVPRAYAFVGGTLWDKRIVPDPRPEDTFVTSIDVRPCEAIS